MENILQKHRDSFTAAHQCFDYLAVVSRYASSLSGGSIKSMPVVAGDLEQAIAPIIDFYTTGLSRCIGDEFRSPSLWYLARSWYDPSCMPLLSFSLLVSNRRSSQLRSNTQHDPFLRPR